MPAAHRVGWLIAATAAARLTLAACTGLGIDESYMVAAGRHLALSYFDHPPISWWLARLAALAVGSEAPLVVRAPFIALFALSTWLMFVLTRALFGERAGWLAAVALNLAPVFGVTTATWVLPDGPLVCALLLAAWAFVRALGRPSPNLALRQTLSSPLPPWGERMGEGDAASPNAQSEFGHRTPLTLTSPPEEGGEAKNCEQKRWPWWLATGLAAGLALMSKYSAALVLAGAAGYLLTQPNHRRWLARPQPYVAAAVALGCCTPALIWNVQHSFASFAFQGGRAAAHAWQPFGPLVTLGGEALFLLPWIWLGLIAAWLAALRAGPRHWQTWLPACLGAVPVVLFVAIAAWARHVLFHWAVPGYLFLFPLLGDAAQRLPPRLLRLATSGSAALVIVGGVVLTLNGFANPLAALGLDPGFQAADWTPVQALLGEGHLFAALTWKDCGKLDYGLRGAAQVLCLTEDPREYMFLPGPDNFAGRDVIIVGPQLTPALVTASVGSRFERIEQRPSIMLRTTPLTVFIAHGLRPARPQ